MPGSEPIGLMRLKDANEAAGLALRLLAGEAPFRDMPTGMSAGAMLQSIDLDQYIFARRGNRAVGFACWAITDLDSAESWMKERIPYKPTTQKIDNAVAIVLAMQALDRQVTRQLVKGLRDSELAGFDLCYFVRDYGVQGKPPRMVRMARPSSRRHHVEPDELPSKS